MLFAIIVIIVTNTHTHRHTYIQCMQKVSTYIQKHINVQAIGKTEEKEFWGDIYKTTYVVYILLTSSINNEK